MSGQSLILWAIPVSALYLDPSQATPAIRLVRRGLDFLKAGFLEDAEQRAREALDVACYWERRDSVGEGAAALFLSNIYWGTGRFGLALDLASRARDVFKKPPSPEQRHNEAIATFNLGLVYHLMGNHIGALNAYYEAQQSLDGAHQHWVDINQEIQEKQCKYLLKWIQHLIDRVIEVPVRQRSLTLSFPIGFAYGATATLWGEYDRDVSLILGGKTLQVAPLRDPLVLTADCCVFPTPLQVHQMIQPQISQASDHVLAQTGDPLPGDPIHISVDSQGIIKFIRLPDGKVILTSQSIQDVTILGQNYRPIALLI